jgi:hypothetical protein
MSLLSRLFNFQPGGKIKSQDVDSELDQLVIGHNDHDGRIVNLEGGLDSNFYTKEDVNNLITEAEFGTPPLGGVTYEYLEPTVRAAVVAGKLAAHSNYGGL